MIRYSVIVPNRNHPDLLRRALASVPRRDDIQLIVVDDASDPTLVDMDRYPGLERPGCQVIFTTEGKGAGYARNAGLEKATGQWLLFLDADDFFTEEAWSLLDARADAPEDIVYFGCRSVFSDTLQPSGRLDNRHMLIARYADRPALLEFHNRYLHTEPWGKMIRRELVEREQIRFDETSCANDYLFSVLTGHKAASTAFDPGILYCVTTRDDSLSFHYFDSPRKTWDRLDVYWRVQQFFDREGVPLPVFYRLWLRCREEGGETLRTAERFRRERQISRLKIAAGCLRCKWRIRMHIGVPYCR